MNTDPIESSSQANLEVNPPSTPSTPSTPDSGLDDWASRLDDQIDSINKDTGATKYGKADESKPSDQKKEAKQEEKPEDKQPEEPKKEETPKGLTEKAAIKWGELRAEAAKAKEYAKQIETLKAELEKAKTVVPDTQELERLRQINQEYEQELAVARIEATQEYKANVVEPMVSIVGYLENLAQQYELNSRDFLTALAEPDPTRQSELITDLASNMSERDRLKFYAATDDYSEVIRRRDFYQSASRERMGQLEAQYQAEIARRQQEAQQSTAQYQQAYSQATNKVFEDLKKSVPVLSDEEVAADVQRLAKEDYSQADPELKSYLAHSGALLPHLVKALKAAKSELEEANKKIAGYRNGTPKAGGGNSESSKMPENIGFLEALESQLGR